MMKRQYAFCMKMVSVLALGALCFLQTPSFAAQKEDIGAVRDIYNGTLFPDKAVRTYSNWDKLFPTRVIKAGGKVQPLPKSDKALPAVTFMSAGKKYDLVDYFVLNQVVAMIILKDGKMIFEHYDRGVTDKTHWMSMSIAKSFVSTMVGAAIKDGAIKSLDDMVVTYLPQLKGSAYEGVSVRNILMMSSGVKWNEMYTDPNSDRRKYLEIQIASNKQGAIFDLMKSLSKAAPPGTVFNYNTGETILVGEVLRAATKKNLTDYCSEKIWKPLGMEADAFWVLDSPNGHEVAGMGMNAVARDYARFGQFILDGAVVNGKKIVPDWWFAEATSPKERGGKTVYYGYQWWPIDPAKGAIHAGAYEGWGIHGQHLYINPKEKLVILALSARPKPTGMDAVSDHDFFAGVIEALR